MSSIDTGVPSSLKRPGTFPVFRFSLSGRGLIPLPLRMACVGMLSSAATATAEEPTQVFDDADADTKFGAGSEIALMCRKAFAQARRQGTQPEIWGCGIAEPGAGTAHAKTATLSGAATEDGNLVIRVAGRTITVGVSSGDAAATVAAALEAELDAQAADLPVTAGVASAVVTCTHVTKGENGGDVDYETVNLPAGLGLVFADGAVGAGVADITNALDALLDKDYDFVAIANRKSADVTDAKANTADAWGYGQKRYRWIVMGDPTTLAAATALGAAANDFTVLIASYEGSPSLPGEVAAAVACYVAGKERPNANYDHGVLELYPPAASSVYTSSEIESALSAGVTPLVPTPEGDLTEIVRLVTTHVTTSSAPDYATFDLATSRSAAYVARQIDARYRAEFPQELLVTDEASPDNVLKRIKDLVVGVHRAAEDLRILRDVDDFLDQIIVEEDGVTAGRVNVANPFRVVSPLHQAVFVHHAYL